MPGGLVLRAICWLLVLCAPLSGAHSSPAPVESYIESRSAAVDLWPGQEPEPPAPPDSAVAADSLSESPTSAPPLDTTRVSPDTTARARPSKEPSALALRGHGRPNPIKAVWQGAKGYVSDMVYLYSAPLRMNATNAVSLGIVMGVGGVLYAYDDDIYQGFQRSREDPTYEAIVIRAGNFFEPLGLISDTHLWLEGASIAGWLLDVPLLRTIPGEILESNSIVGGMRQPIEKLVGRQRPNEGKGARSFTAGNSFPSGHASVVCETASILAHHARHPVARAAIWSIAGIVCLQRVDEPGHNHWPSDVWIGAALGAYAGHTIAIRNEERRRGISQGKWYDIFHRPEKNWSLLPVAGSRFSGLAVRARL
jgi:hypothetical protein